MKRFAWWLFTALAAISLPPLFIACAVEIFYQGDYIYHTDTAARIYYVGFSKNHFQFDISYDLEKWRQPVWNVAIPCWFVILLSSIAPAIWSWIYVHARRPPSPGICRHCGYDLRATPDRCPECGTIPQSKIIST